MAIGVERTFLLVSVKELRIDMSAETLPELVAAWQTGAAIVIASVLTGAVGGFAVVRTGALGLFPGFVVGLLGGTLLAFLALSYLLYGR